MGVTDRALIRMLRVTAAAGSLLTVASTAVLVVTGEAGFLVEEFLAPLALLAVASGVFAWLVAPRQPRNRVVWTMAAAALLGLFLAGPAAVSLWSDVEPHELLAVAPAELPAWVGWTMMFTSLGLSLGFHSWVTFGLLLFPDGSLPSPRWRAVGWLAAAGVAGFAITYAVSLRPTNTVLPEAATVVNSAVAVLLLASVLCLGGLVVRFRRSRGATRQQFKWVAWGVGVFVPVWVGAVLADGTAYEEPAVVPFTVAVGVLVGSYGIAVGKYRLYDIDVVISRTIVYGALAAVITGAYVAAVVGLGDLIGSGDEPNTALAIAATGGVALVFQPLRRWLQRGADRVVYGWKMSPQQVLSEFSRHAATAADGSLLAQVARSLVEGTSATRAAVWVTVDGTPIKTAEWPGGAYGSRDRVASFPIEQERGRLGLLTLSTPPGQHLSDGDLRLASHVASGLALALGNRGLTEALRGRVEQLRESRRRLVAAQDETRRRLELDLHDGAQQQLVAVRVKLGVAQALAEREGRVRLTGSLRRLAEQAEGALDAVRDFARGVYPPMLETEGLRAAIRAHVRSLPVPVKVEVVDVGRYDRKVEETVYFCVIEALHRIATRAHSSGGSVRLHESDGTVTFEVAADAGFGDLDRAELVNLADRVDAANGTFSLHAGAGGTTTIHGTLPAVAHA